MQPLEKTLRNKLERTVKDARDIAEDAAKASLDQIGVGESAPFAHLSETDRDLRRRLRIHGRQLGDTLNGGKIQTMDRLIEEVAYEHWHRMLFARFLAENELLMFHEQFIEEETRGRGDTANSPFHRVAPSPRPDFADAVPITLEEAGELAPEYGCKNGWELSAKIAARMLPQIFRTDSPVFELALPPEHQQKLEKLLADLPADVFIASDSLGWVYQFWQAKRKDAVNASEVKIGARELPAVTQLFTEPYMVAFLLDNSLGAWWAGKKLSADDADVRRFQTEEEVRKYFSIPGVPLEYLRFVHPPSPSGRGAGGEGGGKGGEGKKNPIPKDILENARELRKNQTDAEQLLWGLLRDRRFAGKKFRRQHPVGRYILDFYCHEIKFAIELDGGQHNEEKSKKYDEERTRILNEQGIRVIRFWNNEVLQQTDSVLEALWKALTPTPLPEGEGLWTPAAGIFDAWPKHLRDLKLLDPCCGSGHFLVAAFLMLVPMRMAMEGLTAREAVDAVLRENIHGLEIDPRCVELAAFALALAAWKYPDLPSPSGRGAGGVKPIGYRMLPELNVACSGLSVSVAKEEWKQLGLGKKNLTIALDWMHDTFKDAPVLGSLLDPAKTNAAKIVQWDELSVALEQALKLPSPAGRGAGGEGYEQQEVAVVAQGLAKAATLLAGRYQWVITNVPYLARGKQNERLRDFCEKHYSAAKNDLATVFLDRCLELAVPPSPHGRGAGGEGSLGGTVSVVLPQNWLFLTSYKNFREKLLNNDTWHLIARLGPGAFETISGEVVKAILITLSRGNSLISTLSQKERGLFLLPQGEGTQRADEGLIRGLDVSEPRTAEQKAALLKGSPLPLGEGLGVRVAEIKSVEQAKQLENPDARVMLDDASLGGMLELYAVYNKGVCTGDDPYFRRAFWEFPSISDDWIGLQSTVKKDQHFGGVSDLLL